MQNRLAQREFRQRKQAHVKELEARVEFLSSSKDSQIEQIRAALQGVKKENKLLRNLLAGVTGE